ncbi:MAG: acetate/propionate family kinase [Bacillota bacterium]|jgi:acetate kinase
MKILVLNCGSSSLKYQLIDILDESVAAKGMVEKIGLSDSVLVHKAADKDEFKNEKTIIDHTEAIEMVIEVLLNPQYGAIAGLNEIDAIGHRVVHGGTVFSHSTVLTEEVIEIIESLSELAPLHNPPALAGIRACQAKMPGIPMVGVFDTSFHQTMPPSSYLYGLPYEYYEKYGVRRYGFHGTSHCYVCNRAAEMLGKPLEQLKLISCHLGNGSSIAAVDGGQVLDTTMGFTPVAGLLMGTRCGDMDPSIIPYLMEKENWDADEISNVLNKKSGILGISGVSSDVRHVIESANNGNKRSRIALDIFEKRIIQYIGAYSLQLNGLDAIIFTAGIGENSAVSRQRICDKIGFLGVELDEKANTKSSDDRQEMAITTKDAKVQVLVVHTNEELMIAKDTAKVINEQK